MDFGYSPNFFGSNTNSYVLTTMGDVVVAIPFDRTHSAGIRPYLTGGFGLIRAGIDVPFAGYSVANNDFAANFGGGVMGFFGNHIGVRADLRYIRSLADNSSTRGKGEPMDLTLSDDEVPTLRGLLSDYLPGLKFELARTHGAEIRHVLAKRETLVEQLLDRLPKEPVWP